jgi:hypothetical protein
MWLGRQRRLHLGYSGFSWNHRGPPG